MSISGSHALYTCKGKKYDLKIHVVYIKAAVTLSHLERTSQVTEKTGMLFYYAEAVKLTLIQNIAGSHLVLFFF